MCTPVDVLCLCSYASKLSWDQINEYLLKSMKQSIFQVFLWLGKMLSKDLFIVGLVKTVMPPGHYIHVYTVGKPHFLCYKKWSSDG